MATDSNTCAKHSTEISRGDLFITLFLFTSSILLSVSLCSPWGVYATKRIANPELPKISEYQTSPAYELSISLWEDVPDVFSGTYNHEYFPLNDSSSQNIKGAQILAGFAMGSILISPCIYFFNLFRLNTRGRVAVIILALASFTTALSAHILFSKALDTIREEANAHRPQGPQDVLTYYYATHTSTGAHLCLVSVATTALAIIIFPFSFWKYTPDKKGEEGVTLPFTQDSSETNCSVISDDRICIAASVEKQ